MIKCLVSTLFLILFANLAAADELHILSNGRTELQGEVFRKNALNLLIVTVWTQKLQVFIESNAKIESTDGLPIKLEEIQEGHKLYIQGRVTLSQPGLIDPTLVRDLSVVKGSGIPVPLPPPPVVTSQPPVNPSVNQVPATPAVLPTMEKPVAQKSSLTQYLRPGMKGEEVVILQKFLQKNGWGIPDDGSVTGFFGKVTAQALANFQKAKGLAAVGAAGPKTRALINSLLAK